MFHQKNLVFVLVLGKGGPTKTDEFSEKFQTAFDPPHLRKIILRFFESDQSELQSVVPTLYAGKICGNCILNAKICIEYSEIAKICRKYANAKSTISLERR